MGEGVGDKQIIVCDKYFWGSVWPKESTEYANDSAQLLSQTPAWLWPQLRELAYTLFCQVF